MSETARLDTAVDRLCAALRSYASICRSMPDDPRTVIKHAVDLSSRMLDFEAALRDETGWSNPTRHLGPLTFFNDKPEPEIEESSESEPPDSGAHVHVRAHYSLKAPSVDALMWFVTTRFGDEIDDVQAAIEKLYKTDGWDPYRYGPGLQLRGVDVEVTVEELS